MSNKLKKIVASVMTVASLVVCTAGMSVSAANGKLTVDSSSATLYNESGATRYGNVNFTVINRATGSQVTSAGSSGNVVNYSSITATKGGYSAVTYRFNGNGTLYKGTSQYSGVLWNDSKTY